MTDERWDPVRERVRIAQDLTAIVSYHMMLGVEAIHRAHQGIDDRGDMPGGEAMAALGPVSSMEAWQHRFEAAEERELDTSYAYDQIGEWHPLLVLATWEDAIRDERDQPTDLKATIPRAAAYIRGALDWILGTDDYGDLNFLAVDHLASDLRRVRHELENLLREGDRADRGAPCMECGVALVRDWSGDHDDPRTEYDDHWHCPNRECGKTYTHPQYLKAVEDEYLRSAEWLTASGMLRQWRIPIGTLQSWASRGHVDKKRHPESGRMLYRVDQAKERRAEIEDERMGA